MKCPYCAGRIEDKAAKCRHCGQRLVSAAPRGAQGLGQEIDSRILLFLLVLVLAALCYFVSVFNEGERRPPYTSFRRYSQAPGEAVLRVATEKRVGVGTSGRVEVGAVIPVAGGGFQL